MVNPGAIAATSLLSGWEAIHEGLSLFAGRELAVDEEVYRSASARTIATGGSPNCSTARAASIETPPRRLTCTRDSARCA